MINVGFLRHKFKILLIIVFLIMLNYLFIQSSYKSRNNHKLLYKERVKACFVVLVRNEELEGIVSTIKQVESTFNSRYQYPYIFLNDDSFTDNFKSTVSKLTNANVTFGEIDHNMWGYPAYINQTFAAERREIMKEQGVPYGGSESYRHMCRYMEE